jgi:pyrroline-5-carboxylate reductase
VQKQPVVVFIGAGNMAQSLISGLVKSGFDRSHIQVTDRHSENLQHFANLFGIQTHLSNIEASRSADILVLSVKPQDMQALMLELKGEFQKNKPLLISVSAGIHTDHLEHWLETKTAIVRAMPNAAALLGMSATGLYANSRVTEEQKNLAESLLRAVGITVWMNHEHDLDVVTALSGSGPAYFFLMMETLQQSAEKLGLPTHTARLLTLQTALGAARMTLESDTPLEELRKKITSKGGTTEQALNKLETGGFRSLIQSALQAAKERSIEIGHLFDKE